jgi:quinol monooxygenase YgiN
MKNVIASFVCCLVILSGCNAPSQKTETASCEADKASMKLVMNLTRKVKPEQVSAFKASFEKCKAGTLQEPGCVDYGMYQSYTDSTEFIIVETWKNKGEHLKHIETEHLKVHISEIRDMGDPTFKATNTEIYVCPNVN